MTSKRVLIGACVLASGCLVPLFAQPTATQPTSESRDPNWIGPRSWERQFTIPAFVETSRGLTKKVPSSQPASYATHTTPDYWASRQRRTNTEGSTTKSTATSGTEKKSRSSRSSRSEEGSHSTRSSRSSRSSSSEGHSSRSSSHSSSKSSRSSHSR